MDSSVEKLTIGHFVGRRIRELGIDDVFGVPGDYVLLLIDALIDEGANFVGTCNELNAGYAADGYARVRNVSCLCITFGVGAMSAANAVAGAFSERVPMIVLCGIPPLTRMGVCLRERKPVLVEVPLDMVQKVLPNATQIPPLDVARDSPLSEDSLEECVAEVAWLIDSEKRPLFFTGRELASVGAVDRTLDLLRITQIPHATGIYGKGTVPERAEGVHFAGVYSGAGCPDGVRTAVESARPLILLGNNLSDVNTGNWSGSIPARTVVMAEDGGVSIGHHHYANVPLDRFVDALALKLEKYRYPGSQTVERYELPLVHAVAQLGAAEKLTGDYVFRRLQQLVPPDCVLVGDIGDTAFRLLDLVLPAGLFFMQGFYMSIGFSLPAAIGAAVAAREKRGGGGDTPQYSRVLCFIGDGDAVRHNLDVTLFIINNDGYAIERAIHDGPYNDIQRWNYAKLPAVFAEDPSTARAARVCTTGEFEKVVSDAFPASADERMKGPLLVELVLDAQDVDPHLKLLGKAFSKAK